MRRSTSLQGCRQRLAVMPVALVMSAANGSVISTLRAG
jgi:hypothetical protein